MKLLLTAIVFTLVSVVSYAGSKPSILEKAAPYLPTLQKKINRHWPTLTKPQVLAGQVETESRWDPKAKLSTPRELGRGLSQMTITSKFNIYKEAVKLPALKGWDWEKDPYNPTNQLTYLVLADRSNFTRVSKMFINEQEKLAGALVSYNAGMGTVLQRRALAIKQGKNNGKWFGGLDKIRLPYEKRLLYGRDLGEMRNDYPRLIFQRSSKYENYFNLHR